MGTCQNWYLSVLCSSTGLLSSSPAFLLLDSVFVQPLLEEIAGLKSPCESIGCLSFVCYRPPTRSNSTSSWLGFGLTPSTHMCSACLSVPVQHKSEQPWASKLQPNSEESGFPQPCSWEHNGLTTHTLGLFWRCVFFLLRNQSFLKTDGFLESLLPCYQCAVLIAECWVCPHVLRASQSLRHPGSPYGLLWPKSAQLRLVRVC